MTLARVAMTLAASRTHNVHRRADDSEHDSDDSRDDGHRGDGGDEKPDDEDAWSTVLPQQLPHGLMALAHPEGAGGLDVATLSDPFATPDDPLHARSRGHGHVWLCGECGYANVNDCGPSRCDVCFGPAPSPLAHAAATAAAVAADDESDCGDADADGRSVRTGASGGSRGGDCGEGSDGRGARMTVAELTGADESTAAPGDVAVHVAVSHNGVNGNSDSDGGGRGSGAAAEAGAGAVALSLGGADIGSAGLRAHGSLPVGSRSSDVAVYGDAAGARDSVLRALHEVKACHDELVSAHLVRPGAYDVRERAWRPLQRLLVEVEMHAATGGAGRVRAYVRREAEMRTLDGSRERIEHLRGLNREAAADRRRIADAVERQRALLVGVETLPLGAVASQLARAAKRLLHT